MEEFEFSIEDFEHTRLAASSSDNFMVISTGNYRAGSAVILDCRQVKDLRDYLTEWLNKHAELSPMCKTVSR